MKKLLILIISAFMINLSTSAKQIVVDDSLLTDNQKTMINTKNTVETVGQYVGLGKEIGEATNGCLTAITDNANKFANTKVGTWAMVLVTYKVIGKELISFVVGIIIFFVVLFVLLWQFKSGYLPRKTAKNAGLLQWFKGNIEYDIKYPDSDMKSAALVVLCVGMIINLIATAMIMFG